MRDEWTRANPSVSLSLDQLSQLVQPAFAGHSVVEQEPAQGGLANTNIRARLSGSHQVLLVRLFQRSPEEAGKEYALNRHIHPRVPTPAIFHFAGSNPVTGHPCMLMEWVEGTRLEVAARSVLPPQAAQLGRAIGASLAAIHSFHFPQSGFFDSSLVVAQPISVGSDGLVGFLHSCLIEGRGEARLGSDLTRRLMDYVECEGVLLDSYEGPPCLTHSDFGGSNILVREVGDGWEVAAVLDWEFAFSGSPFFDLGNLLRPPLGDLPGFEQGVYDGYTAAGGVLPERWRQMSRIADLLAWADFMNRPTTNDALIRDARDAIRRTIQAFA